MLARTYRVVLRQTRDFEFHVVAEDFDDAEAKALKEVTALVGGYDPEILWAIEVENTDNDDA